VAAWDPVRAAEIEARVRAAAAELEANPNPDTADPPEGAPGPKELMVLLNRSRPSVDNYFTQGVNFGPKRLLLRYWIVEGGTRVAHPADVLAILAERRKLRSADHPDGIPQGGDDEGPSSS